MNPLSIYKASAGSGKTYTLAIEFIKLLIKEPESFKSILAVTFTNKATEEMKTRILSQLYGIWKGLDDSQSYLNDITKALGITKNECRIKAGHALSYLLHDYNHFRVETIDSFFQSIMRNLARELDLTANLKIDLKDESVKDQAVDLLIESLDEKNVLLQWIISYILSNIEENKSWNVIGQIKDFGKTIFKDYYKDVSKQLAIISKKKGFYENYIKDLKALKEDSDNKMIAYAKEFKDILASNDIEIDDLSGKSRGIITYFNKLENSNYSDIECWKSAYYKHLEADGWPNNNSINKQKVLDLAKNQLVDFLKKVDQDRHLLWKLRSSAEYTLRHISKLRLLNSIEEKVRALNFEANRFLLSDTQHLLRALIKDSDTPFIFEKTGTSLKHIMIDEFQDTSIVQWTNFKVLLNECMSQSSSQDDNIIKNLIVGDVKQSIYRWRSGDWRLLNDIDKEFLNPKKELSHFTLFTNYRSKRNIVEFNNHFFSEAVKIEYKSETEVNSAEDSEEILKAYSDICQEVPQGKQNQGLVHIDLLSKEEYQERVLEKIVSIVDKLLEKKVNQNDIAILVRANKYIPLIAEAITIKRPDIKVVSDEAFALKSSLAIRIIIMGLRLIKNPNDSLCKTSLALTYQRIILSNPISEEEIHSHTSKQDFSYIDNLLPEPFNNNLSSLEKMTLLEMVETIYSAFGVYKLKGQGAYICTFYDAIADFTKEYVASVDGFLQAWEDSIKDQNILSEDVDGIRILSIHKSKGLEFKNVIIPFCDWKMDNSRTMLWCKPSQAPFSKLPLVPIDYNKGTLDTIYALDYKNEHIQNTVDNLNMLYVAFTRASNNLFVIGKNTTIKNSRSKLLKETLETLKDTLKGFHLNAEEDDNLTYEYGTLYVDTNEEDKISKNVFLANSSLMIVDITPHPSIIEFRQHNQSFEFIHNQDDKQKTSRDSYIKLGNVLHAVFSKIRTLFDVDSILRQLEFSGIFSENDISLNEIKELIKKSFASSKATSWFDPHWTVFNECSISYFDSEENKVFLKRPDRVIMDENQMIVIDFKFGSSHEGYHNQVRQYMSLLKSMGYKNITGYLWFVLKDVIEEVEPLKDDI